MRLRSYKFRIYPAPEQKVRMAAVFGSVRWVWNEALALRAKTYEDTQKGISDYDLIFRVVEMKKNDATAWLKDAPSQALQSAILHQGKAFSAFFKKTAAFPKFKSRYGKQSFSLPQGVDINWADSQVRIPKFMEGIDAKLHRKFSGKIKTCTVSKTPTGKYYIGILVEEVGEELPIAEPVFETCVGIDLGIKEFAVLSNGVRVENPKHLAKRLKALRKAQKILSRRKAGSKRRDKQKAKVARIHEKVADARRDFHHQFTSRLVKNQDYGSFAIEDLGIQDLLKKSPRHMARAISDAGWHQFRTILTYKANRAGKAVLTIGRYEPSSKMCPCGIRNDKLTLADRTWTCQCGKVHDRDLLAANNIKTFAFIAKDKVSVSSGTVTPKISASKVAVLGRESPEVTREEIGLKAGRRIAKNSKKICPKG